MIIYGRKGTHTGSIAPQILTCPSCNTKGEMIFSAYSNYAHIFWIPIFPFSKSVYSHCKHCKQALETKEMPSEFRTYVTELKSSVRPPIWTFTGMFLIAGLVSWSFYTSGKNADNNKLYISSPQVGDIYEVKTESKAWTLFKVKEVNADTVFILFNKFEVDKLTGLYKIKKDENFEAEATPMIKSTLLDMFNNGEIYDVERVED
jgi:hypothetical protein